METHATCIRCGREAAYSEAQLAKAHAPIASLALPSLPLPPNICARCALEDPALRADLEAWAETAPD